MTSADEKCKHVANKLKKPIKELGIEPFPRGAGEFDSHALPPVYLTIGSSENLSHMVTEKSVEKTLKMESVRSLSKLFWHRP